MGQSNFEKANPLYRYKWLNKRYTFGGEYTFTVDDRVSGCSFGCSGRYVNTLEVYPVSVTEESFPRWLKAAFIGHELTNCFILDEEGKELGRCEAITHPDFGGKPKSIWYQRCPDDFLKAKFFVLEDPIVGEKVVVYEMMAV